MELMSSVTETNSSDSGVKMWHFFFYSLSKAIRQRQYAKERTWRGTKQDKVLEQRSKLGKGTELPVLGSFWWLLGFGVAAELLTAGIKPAADLNLT